MRISEGRSRCHFWYQGTGVKDSEVFDNLFNQAVLIKIKCLADLVCRFKHFYREGSGLLQVF